MEGDSDSKSVSQVKGNNFRVNILPASYSDTPLTLSRTTIEVFLIENPQQYVLLCVGKPVELLYPRGP